MVVSCFCAGMKAARFQEPRTQGQNQDSSTMVYDG
jgi:hypothetical protein